MIIESIQAYKDIVKDSKGGQEAVGFERVAENVESICARRQGSH